MSKITTGKWEFVEKDNWCEVQVKSPLKSICAVNTNVEEYIENGKLLAAAPELLDALRVCYASLCTYGSHPIIEKQVNNVLRNFPK